MKKIDYLKLALQWKCHQTAHWCFSAMAITREGDEDWKQDPYNGRLVRTPTSISFVQEGELVQIEDGSVSAPLFAAQEPMVLDPTWMPNIKEVTPTCFGAVLANQLLLVDVFRHKVPYIPYRLDMGNIEEFIITNRADDVPGKPRDPNKIYVDEYLAMSQPVEFIRTLNTLSTSSLTDRNMTMPDGLPEKKAELLKKYGDLTDPVKLANFEAELGKFADEYRKGDPSEGKLVKGKIRNNSIRKMFISSGAEGGMGGAMVPVTESLSDGLTYSPEVFQALANGARSGSYFRGLDTVKGGVSFKLAVRVLSSFMVRNNDCGSNMGLEVVYSKSNISQLVGRSIIGSTKGPIQNKDEASNYLGTTLRVRSPGFCRSKSSVVCETCAGSALASFPEGLAIPASNVTGIILAASMAAMHKNTTEVVELDLDEVIS